METHEIVAWSIAGVNGIAAVLAWAAKLRWSREFAIAKDETIRAKDAQVNALRERVSQLEGLSAPVIRDIHSAHVEMFTKERERLNQRVEKLQDKISKAGKGFELLEQAFLDLRKLEAKHWAIVQAVAQSPIGQWLVVQASIEMEPETQKLLSSPHSTEEGNAEHS